MKIKTIVLGWILLSITQVATSQITFGVHGGISFFRETQFDSPILTSGPVLVDRFTDGYYVALLTDIPIKNNFSIQGELSLIRKGRSQVKLENIKFINLGSDWRVENRYQFLEIPIIGKYHIDISQYLGLDLGLGVSVGYLLQYKYWFRENFIATSTNVEIPKNPEPHQLELNRWDMGPVVDIAFPTKTKFGNFIVGFRGSMDFKKLRSAIEIQGQTIPLGRSYNWGMVIYTGYTFGKNNFHKNRNPESELE